MRAFLGTCFIAFAAPAPPVERLRLAAAVLALAFTFPLEASAQERARVAEDTLVRDPKSLPSENGSSVVRLSIGT